MFISLFCFGKMLILCFKVEDINHLWLISCLSFNHFMGTSYSYYICDVWLDYTCNSGILIPD